MLLFTVIHDDITVIQLCCDTGAGNPESFTLCLCSDATSFRCSTHPRTLSGMLTTSSCTDVASTWSDVSLT